MACRSAAGWSTAPATASPAGATGSSALARRLGCPGLYLAWARLALAAYQGLTYSRGRFGRLADRLLPPDSRAG